MEPLDYASSCNKQTSRSKSIGIFVPLEVAVVVCAISCNLLPNNLVDPVCIITIFAAEVTTVLLLLKWRGELKLFAVVTGWVIAGLGALYVGFLAAVFF